MQTALFPLLINDVLKHVIVPAVAPSLSLTTTPISNPKPGILPILCLGE